MSSRACYTLGPSMQQEDGVGVFGAAAKSDTEMIMEMLAKLPGPEACTAMPPRQQPFAPTWASEAPAPGPTYDRGLFRQPPGLGAPAHLAGTSFQDTHFKKTTDEEVSTGDEGAFSEHSFEVEGCINLCCQAATEEKTTFMVRNVPLMYTQELLLEEWKGVGKFDFLYLPRTAGGKTNLSYVFINFVSEAEAAAFQLAWHKKRLTHFTSRKPLNISFAEVQGLQANLMQLRKKRDKLADARQHQPLVLVSGEYLPLPDVLQHLTF
mmetsp:Transcript_43250/g.123729  ORF Transcript_43250/g.123729 Transcript_43250/m.123729 type:complete len:265 (+) Transcript_43250:112-906(+)